MEDDVSEDVQLWTAKRYVTLVLNILKGDTSVAEAARKLDLKVAEIEERQERPRLAAENALHSRPRDEDTLKEEEISLDVRWRNRPDRLRMGILVSCYKLRS